MVTPSLPVPPVPRGCSRSEATNLWRQRLHRRQPGLPRYTLRNRKYAHGEAANFPRDPNSHLNYNADQAVELAWESRLKSRHFSNWGCS